MSRPPTSRSHVSSVNARSGPGPSTSTYRAATKDASSKARRSAEVAVIFEGEGEDVEQLNRILNELIDVILDNYVSSWYTSISPHDRSFLPLLRQTITSFLRSLGRSYCPFTSQNATSTSQTHASDSVDHREDGKERIVQVLALQLPELLARHWEGWRIAERLVDERAVEDDVEGDAKRESDGMHAVDKTKALENDQGHDKIKSRRNKISDTFLRIHPHPGIIPPTSPVPSTLSPPSHTTYTTTTPPDPPANAGKDKTAPNSKLTVLDPTYLPSLILPLLLLHLHIPSSPPGPVNPNIQPNTTSNARNELAAPSPLILELTSQIIGNAVLGGVVRKFSEPGMIWKVALILLSTRADEGRSHDLKSELAAKSSQQNESLSFATLSAHVLSLVHAVTHRTLTFMHAVSSALLALSGLAKRIRADWDEAVEKPGLADQEKSPTGTTQKDETTTPHNDTYGDILDPWIQLLSTALRVDDPIVPGGKVRQSVWRIVEIVVTVLAKPADALIPHYIRTRLLTARTTTLAIAKLQTTMFPGGKIAPAVPDITEEEAEEMRREFEQRLEAKLPDPIANVLLGPTPAYRHASIADILEPLSDPATNTHLLLTIVDALIQAIA